MSKNVTTYSDPQTKSEKEIPKHGGLVPFSGRGESLSMPSATEEIDDGMAANRIDNGNENGDEEKDKAAELSRTVIPVQETTSQQIYKEPNKGDVSQSQSNSKTPDCPKQSISQTAENVDWQFYLDTLAPRISKEMHSLATYLKIPTSKQENIGKDYKTEHERCFHLLWAWHLQSKGNDGERLGELNDALIEAGLRILTEERIKTRSMYTYEGDNLDGETTFNDESEIRKVAGELGNVHARLGRYFKLKEEEITRVFNKWNNDSIEQANEIIASCVKNGYPRTRQELCNGLKYVENNRLIETMKKYWSS